MHSPDGIMRGRNLKFHVYAGHYRSRGRRRTAAVDGHANTQTRTHTYTNATHVFAEDLARRS